MTLSYRANMRWHNHGRNVQSTVARYYEPCTVAEVQEIVRTARRDGKTVRAVGDSHSWSPLVLTDGYLISTRRLNRVLSVSRDPARITVEPGVTVAETLRAGETHGVCLPMNVDIPTLTIGGAVAVGANGFSPHWGPYSDFVEEVELVTGTGDLRTISRAADPQLWSAVAASLGLFGVFTKITLRLVPMFHVRVESCRLPQDEALATFAAPFGKHDYAQYFWFPCNDYVTLDTADVTDAPRTWHRRHAVAKEVNGWLETAGTHLADPLLRRFPRVTPLFGRLAGASMKERTDVMLQSENMLLGPWINYMVPSQNVSVSFPPGPDCRWLRIAWQMAVDLVARHAERGRYPANLAMNARLFARSAALLHSLPGDTEPTTANIQITSFHNRHWARFSDQLMTRWLRIPGARPHWAKQYQDVRGIAATLRTVYGSHLDTFLQLRQAGGFDPDNVFVNPFLRELFFCPLDGQSVAEAGRAG